MKVFAISDLHLSTVVEKPMNVFGDDWNDYFEKITADWQEKVTENDVILLGGDLSWGISIDEAKPDYDLISALNGKKVVVRGNHDYYWDTLSKIQKAFPDFFFLQNNCIRIGNLLVVGSRGWTVPTDDTTQEDKKIYDRELIRLELSLTTMQRVRKPDDYVVALLHYPPFDAKYNDTAVTALLEKYEVNAVTYGHLHGKNVRVTPKVVKNDIPYYLTSCDLIGNHLVFIADLGDAVLE